MLNHLIINPHLTPSFILLVVGASLTIISLLHLFIRSKAIVWPPIPDEKFSAFEKRLLNIGAIAFAIGVLTLAIIDSFFGHKYVSTDVNGNREIKQLESWISGFKGD